VSSLTDISVTTQTGSRVCSFNALLVRGIKHNEKPHSLTGCQVKSG
jgi:hypothetical protein